MIQIYRQVAASVLLALFILISISADVFAASGKIKAKEIHQTMEGFGAAIAWGDGTLVTHLKKDEIYHYIFNDLGLDILRLRNTYRDGVVESASNYVKIVKAMDTLSDEKPKILLSSWTPQGGIKNNNNLIGGTLKYLNGKYLYGDFARYWVESITWHKRWGMAPDYISIQNEPDFTATWESCVFDPTENATNAGYDQALDSVSAAIQTAGLSTHIIGPEVSGIGFNKFQNYAQKYNHSHLYGYAYHLYSGGSGDVNSITPDAFKNNLLSIASNYSDKPIFMSEYDYGDWFQTACLIHNCIVDGNASGYLWWELVWGPGGKPLIEMPSSSTYTITKYYWAFRQYSKFISAGWKRVTSVSDTTTLKMSAFINPEGNKLTIVILNIGTTSDSMNLDFQDFSITKGTLVCTSDSDNGLVVDSNYTGASAVPLPAHSISTLLFSGDLAAGVKKGPFIPSGFSLSQNYPNPFNPATSIDYSLARESFVHLNIYDVLGRKVKTLVQEKISAGKHTVMFEANDLGSGIYFYKIQAGDFSQSKIMILTK